MHRDTISASDNDEFAVERRAVLQRGAAWTLAVAFPTIVPATALGRAGRAAPSERIALGFLGVGGRGRSLLRVVVVVLCLVGCRDESTVGDSPAGVRGTAPRAESPTQMTEQAILEALRSGQTPAAAERFVPAFELIDAVGGQLRFDAEGRLRTLDLSRDRTSVDVEQLPALAVFPHLRRLRLAGSNLGNEQLSWIAEHWNGLQELGLHHASIDDEGLQVLEQFDALSVLSLRAVAKLSDAGIETIAGLPQLQQLFLVENRLTGHGLASLAALTRLEVLDIRGCTAIAADDLRPLAALPRLRVLRLGGPQIGDEALIVLRDFPELQSLTIEEAPLSDQGLTNLAKLNLTEFNLAHCYQVTDEGLENLLAELGDLQHVALRDMSIRGAFLSALQGNIRLQTLRLNETFVDDGALQHLVGAEHLTRLEIRQGQIGADGTELLGRLSGLEYLDLAENRLTDAAVDNLSNLKHLEFLDISGNPEISDLAVQALERMPLLQELNVARTDISPAGLARLQQQLPSTHITHDTVAAFRRP